MEIAQGRDISLIVLAVEAGLFTLVVVVVLFFAIRGVRQARFQAGRSLRRGQEVMADVEDVVARYSRSPFAWLVALAGLIYRLFLLARRAAGRSGGR